MTTVLIKKVRTRLELRRFVKFPLSLYMGKNRMEQYCPALFFDDMGTLSRKNNPLLEFSEFELFLAYKDGKVVGRVAAIVNSLANRLWNHNEVRFGWFDFVDDPQVSKALLDAVSEFGKSKGMDTITGPLGFTDFDPEGMLFEGYDRPSTMALRHNWPYYNDHMLEMGYEKETDWVENRIFVPEILPDKFKRVASIVEEQYGFKLKKLTRKQILRGDIGHKLFDLINRSYASLYNFTILPQGIVDVYISKYMGLIDPKYVAAVFDREDNLVAFGVTMPSITNALKKCKGRLFPFGWFYVLRSMFFKYEDTLEMLLIGVKPELQKRGVNSLIFNYIIEVANEGGFKYAETNANLEDNFKSRTQWKDLPHETVKRRRVYTKKLSF